MKRLNEINAEVTKGNDSTCCIIMQGDDALLKRTEAAKIMSCDVEIFDELMITHRVPFCCIGKAKRKRYRKSALYNLWAKLEALAANDNPAPSDRPEPIKGTSFLDNYV